MPYLSIFNMVPAGTMVPADSFFSTCQVFLDSVALTSRAFHLLLKMWSAGHSLKKWLYSQLPPQNKTLHWLHERMLGIYKKLLF